MANSVRATYRRKLVTLNNLLISKEFFGVLCPVQTLDVSIESDPSQLVFPEFWNNDKYSDIDIIVDSQVIPAHKIIRKRDLVYLIISFGQVEVV